MDLYDIGIGARVKHPTLGVGVVYDLDAHSIHIFFREHGEKPIARSFEDLVVVAPGVEVEPEALDLESVKDALREVLEEDNSLQRPVPLARRWQKGILEMRSADPALKSKEVPIEDFFHKIVMIRDRFRVLEQKITPARTSVSRTRWRCSSTSRVATAASPPSTFSSRTRRTISWGKRESRVVGSL
ncbi:MAG: hypothetical protein IPL81_11925 [Flavobacteriales bacterium]|nr:hypothetical protein [Flavobacteriales bacterium]